jgi:hypothetical protein
MSDGLLGGSPAETPPADNGNAGGGADVDNGAQSTNDWQSSLPDDLKGLVETKGWKEPADALNSYKNLESVFGADKAGRTLMMPKDAEDKEALDKVYAALGRPEDAAGYGFNEAFKDQIVDQGFVDGMTQAMHEAGLSKAQAAKLATKYNDMYQGAMAAQEAAYANERSAFEKTVDPERLEMARRGFRLFGLPQGEMGAVSRAIEMSLGMEKAVEIFANMGRKIGEDKFVSGEAATSPTSPQGAERRMSEKMSDKMFMDRYLAGDKNAIAEIEELAKMAAAK